MTDGWTSGKRPGPGPVGRASGWSTTSRSTPRRARARGSASRGGSSRGDAPAALRAGDRRQPGRRGAPPGRARSRELAGLNETTARRRGHRRHRAGHQPVAPRDAAAACWCSSCRRRRRRASRSSPSTPARAWSVDRCLRDGYSTGGTPGTGLGAVRRLVDEFDALLDRRRAARVVMARVRPRPTGRRRRAASAGARCRRRRRTKSCAATPGAWPSATARSSVMVADGLGHGVDAAEAADARRGRLRPAAVRRSRGLLRRGPPGAAPAPAARRWRWPTSPAAVRFAGVGNIAGSLVAPGGQGRGLLRQNGTVGVQMRAAATARLSVAGPRAAW